jgi:hypothetical protein
MPGENIKYELSLMTSEGSSGYVLAVVEPPVSEENMAFLIQPDPIMPPAEVGGFADGSQFFAYHKASIDMMGAPNEKARQTKLGHFATRLAQGVPGLAFTDKIMPLSKKIEERILKVQQKKQSTVPSLKEQNI